MNKSQILSRLKERMEKERAAYDAAGLPGYVRLNKTRYFSSMRKQEVISRRIAAIETAISVLEGPFHEADIARGVLLGISDARDDKDELLRLAGSSSMNDRARACQELFDTSLPICRNEILNHIN